MSAADLGYHIDDPILRQYRCNLCHSHFFSRSSVLKHIARHREPFSCPDMSPVLSKHPQETVIFTPPVAAATSVKENSVGKEPGTQIKHKRRYYAMGKLASSSPTVDSQGSRKRKLRSSLEVPAKKTPKEGIADGVNSLSQDQTSAVGACTGKNSFEDQSGFNMGDICELDIQAEELSHPERNSEDPTEQDPPIEGFLPEVNLLSESMLSVSDSMIEKLLNFNMAMLETTESTAATVNISESLGATVNISESTTASVEILKITPAIGGKSETTATTQDRSENEVVSLDFLENTATTIGKSEIAAATEDKSGEMVATMDESESVDSAMGQSESQTTNVANFEAKAVTMGTSESTAEAVNMLGTMGQTEISAANVDKFERSALPLIELAFDFLKDFDDIKNESSPNIEDTPQTQAESESESGRYVLESYFVRMIPEYRCKKCSYVSLDMCGIEYHCVSRHSLTDGSPF